MNEGKSWPVPTEVQHLSMKPYGDAFGYKISIDYKDDYHQFGIEVSLESFTEAIAHVLFYLPHEVRKAMLQRLGGK